MDTPIVVALISASASLAVAVITFFYTKRKEREVEWRKQKIEYYREFFDALNGIVGTGGTSEVRREAQCRWARVVNTIGLVASQRVLVALWEFQDTIAKCNSNSSTEDHNKRLNLLMLAIRADLGITPVDDPTFFSFRLWDSGSNG